MRTLYFFFHTPVIKSHTVSPVSIKYGWGSDFALIGLYYFVHISTIKAGTEVVEDLSLRRIEQIFQFLFN